MNKEVEQKVKDLVDIVEEQYGNILGIEIGVEHPLVEGEVQDFGDIKEVIIIHKHKTSIK